MRKFLIVAAVMALTISSVSPAQAARRGGYKRSRTIFRMPQQRQGIFARLMEMERRKNAIIFGR